MQTSLCATQNVERTDGGGDSHSAGGGPAKSEVGGFWPGRALKKLFGHCAQPRQGALERRERAERRFQQQRAAAAAAAEAAAEGARRELGASAEAASGRDDEASEQARAAPRVEGGETLWGKAPEGTAAAPGLRTGRGAEDKAARSPALSSAPEHPTSPSGLSAGGGGAAGSSSSSGAVGAGARGALSWPAPSSPRGITSRSTLPDSGVSGGTDTAVTSATPLASPQKLVRGPGGQWRPGVATGGGAGRPRAQVVQKSSWSLSPHGASSRRGPGAISVDTWVCDTCDALQQAWARCDQC